MSADRDSTLPDARTERRLFERYKKNGSLQLRNILIVMFLPLVKNVAMRILSRVPAEVTREELESSGYLGLIDAIERYETSRNLRFSTFGGIKIRSAILDELRSIDWMPRLARKRMRQVEAATSALRNLLCREPTTSEIAAHLGWSTSEARKYFGANRPAAMRSLFTLGTNHFGANGDGQMPSDPRCEDPVREAQRRMLRDVMLRGMSRNERLILTLYYYEGLTMKEIGSTLDLSESRVSQMHAQIRRGLRSRLGGFTDMRDELAA